MANLPEGFQYDRRGGHWDDAGPGPREYIQYDIYKCEDCGEGFSRARWETKDEWRLPMERHDCGGDE